MGESSKAVLAFVLILSIAAALFAWIFENPGPTGWGFRIGAPVVGVLAIAALMALQFRRDAAPDYLHQISKTYFNVDGFCFAIKAEAHEGTCRILAYFQNQYENPCKAEIELVPLPGFFLTAAKVDTLRFEIPCEGAGYGVAAQLIAVPRALQQKSQIYNVGAVAEYPGGKGRRLRFRDGTFLRENTPKGRSVNRAIRTGLVAGASPWYFLYRPPRVKLQFPSGIAAELTAGQTQIKTLWKLGDAAIDPEMSID